MSTKKALFIGNGINRLENSSSWEELLDEIASSVYLDEVLANLDEKPFPLMFEELTNRYADKNPELDFDLCSKELVDRVAQLTQELVPNETHQQLVELGISNIITTNYDHGFEKALDSAKYPSHNLWRESKYSLFRRRIISSPASQGNTPDVAVWHVHGEADNASTIALGFDHYAGSLQKMRNYVTSGIGPKNKVKSPFVIDKIIDFDENSRKRERSDASSVFSWLDIFFRDDVHIAGVDLDFSEINLWWAISYKQRLRLKKSSQRNKAHLPIRETYYYMPFVQKLTDMQSAKKALLEGFGVNVVLQSVKSKKREDKNKTNKRDYHRVYERLIHEIAI